MAKIHVDGKTIEVNGSDNLLQACLSHGLDIPYFCWHPALDSVGACRQCAIKQYKDADDKNGRIVMSCMTPASDNTYISIADDEAKEFRETIISFLMTNHPHDCPVCEEGGHCHLQDMTVMTGHHNRDYRFTKRTHKNQYLGPFIGHEMNRCISCYRCVRYYKDYAGGKDLGVYGSAANVYFGRESEGVLESEFSGNLSEVCPTGVFTDKTHSERYTRKWDMQFAPSICTGCAVGCNISPGERYGEVRRIENRYNGDVNGYFLCDRGRFGYGFVNRKDRPRQVTVRSNSGSKQLTRVEGLTAATALLQSGKPVIGIGSPRASVEANAALRALVGAQNFYSGVNAHEHALNQLVWQIIETGPVKPSSLRNIETCDAVLILGEDVLATAPRVALAVRQAARGKQLALTSEKKVSEWQAASVADIAQHALNPVFIATPSATKLDEIAAYHTRLSPEAIAQFAQAIAHAIDPSCANGTVTDAEQAQAREVATALLAAQKPLVVSGTGCGNAAVIQAAANVAWALAAQNPQVALSLAVAEVNSIGMAMFQAPALDQALAQAAASPSVVIVLENDLSRRVSHTQLSQALQNTTVIAVDHQSTMVTEGANLVLPAATFAEGDGTYINMEGRAQRYFQNFDPAYYDRHIDSQDAWRWFTRLRVGATAPISLDETIADTVQALPQFANIVAAAPNAAFRINGLKLARAPQRQSGRTAARANIFVHEPRSTQDGDAALNFSMEGFNSTQLGERPAALIPFAWAPGWNSPQAWSKFQDEVGGHLKGGDAGCSVLSPGSNHAYFAPSSASPSAALTVQALQLHFGSEELSARAAPIQERIPQAYVALNMSDAQKLGVEHQSLAIIEMGDYLIKLPAKVRMDFPQGLVGLPVGLAGIPPVISGTTIRVSKGT